ncbi:MAG: fasciclin domain-containing protein [Cyanobacteria bacterium P01_G01_bin.39]
MNLSTRVHIFTTVAIIGAAFSALVTQSISAQITATATPSSLSKTTTIAKSSANIIEALSDAENFDTLVQMLETAGLSNAVADPSRGPLTVFAPTDAAFDTLPDSALKALLEPENQELFLDILTYHAVSGTAIPAAEVTSGAVLTLSEDELPIELVEETVMVDGATVVQPDIQAVNGIIHGIDAILVPNSASAEFQNLLQ